MRLLIDDMTLPPRLLSLMRLLPEWGRRVLLVMLCWQCAGLFWSVAAPSTGNVDLSVGAETTIARKDVSYQSYRGTVTFHF